MNLSRMNIVKWLLEKLLTSFVTSVIIYFGPMLGLNFQKIGFGYVYTLITLSTFVVSVMIYLLIPKDQKTPESIY